MKFLKCKHLLRMYSKTLQPNNCSSSSFSKHQWLFRRYYSPLSTDGICSKILNNSSVRSYLDGLISKDYSDAMSKPNVSALLIAIRSIKVDLQSLKEFDTGEYDNLLNF